MVRKPSVRQRRCARKSRTAAWTLILGLSGCGVDARVELAAAMSIDRIAAGLQTAIDEYHRDLDAADEQREDAVVEAFIARIRRDYTDEPATNHHVARFREAMRRVRADRSVEWERYAASMENLSTLREVAAGLQRLATESLTLSDEARRYLHGLLDGIRQANTESRQAEEDHGNRR